MAYTFPPLRYATNAREAFIDDTTMTGAAETAALVGVPQSAEISETEEREFVQVVRFGVANNDQSRLIQIISEEVERWVRACPGFISCQMHASQDGNYVLNYAHWQNEAAFRVFAKHPENAVLGAAIRNFGPTSGPDTACYHLMRCILSTATDVQAEPLVTRATS
jgi:C-6 monooxygenase